MPKVQNRKPAPQLSQHNRASLRAWMKSKASINGRLPQLTRAEVEAFNAGAYDPLKSEHVFRALGHVPGEGLEHYDTSETAEIDRSKNTGRLRLAATVHPVESQDKYIVPFDTDSAEQGEVLTDTTEHNAADIPTGQLVLEGYQLTSKLVAVNNSLIFSRPDYDVYILSRLLKRISRAQEFYALQGTGTGQPNGLNNTATDSGVTLTLAGGFAYDDLVDIEQSVTQQDDRDNGLWVGHPTHIAAMKKVTDSGGRPAYMPQTPDGEWMPTMFGHPILETPRCPTSHLFFGNFEHLHYRESVELKMFRSSERYAEMNQQLFSAIITFDCGLSLTSTITKTPVS